MKAIFGVIFLIAFAARLIFEVFYSWARVQLKSVFGNFLKEIFPRLAVLTLLALVYLNQITKENFIWWLTGLYYLRLIIMIFYSFSLYLPKFTFSIPKNTKSILIYSLYILLAGSAASFLIDIDKFMIPQKQAISQTAFYAVAVFIATVVEIPGRAMFQIINPLVAKALNENNFNELKKLYSSSSINLLIVAGLIFLLINSSISPFYDLMIEKDYANGIWVVLMISISKLILMSFGCGPAILATSKFYKITLPFSILMAFSVYYLNDILIDIYGINGAALSTLIVVLFFTVLKIIFIKYKLKISPYSINSLKVVSIIIVMFFAFQNFKITDNSILSIIIDSILISIIYTTVIYFMNVSKPINKLIKSILYGKLRL